MIFIIIMRAFLHIRGCALHAPTQQGNWFYIAINHFHNHSYTKCSSYHNNKSSSSSSLQKSNCFSNVLQLLSALFIIVSVIIQRLQSFLVSIGIGIFSNLFDLAIAPSESAWFIQIFGGPAIISTVADQIGPGVGYWIWHLSSSSP